MTKVPFSRFCARTSINQVINVPMFRHPLLCWLCIASVYGRALNACYNNKSSILNHASTSHMNFLSTLMLNSRRVPRCVIGQPSEIRVDGLLNVHGRNVWRGTGNQRVVKNRSPLHGIRTETKNWARPCFLSVIWSIYYGMTAVVL